MSLEEIYAMYTARVMGVSIIAAVVYGVVHDQITVRLCVEYFTAAHPALFPTFSPTVLALYWGVAATIWLGAIFGGVLAVVSESGGLPPVPIIRLIRWIAVCFVLTAFAAAIAGFTGFELARRSIVSLPAELEGLLSRAEQNRFVAVWFAHIASYAAGMVGASLLIARLWQERGRPRVFPLFPRSAMAFVRTCLLLAILIVIIGWRFART